MVFFKEVAVMIGILGLSVLFECVRHWHGLVVQM